MISISTVWFAAFLAIAFIAGAWVCWELGLSHITKMVNKRSKELDANRLTDVVEEAYGDSMRAHGLAQHTIDSIRLTARGEHTRREQN